MSDWDEDEGGRQELFEHFRIQVDKGQSLLRIDKFLTARLENVSRNRIQMAAEAGNVFVNGVAVKSNYRIKPNDLITIVLAYPPRDVELIPEDIPLDILYEDDDILVLNKHAGLVVHPGHGNFNGTLVNALTYHFSRDSLHLGKEGWRHPFVVHRIDKDTSGVMMVAKHELAQNRLAKQFFDHSIDRKYTALVWGDFREDEGTISGHIGRSLRDRLMMDVFPGGEHGKHAITHYRVKERFSYVTLVECRLETGRTHQIRVHMKYAGHPLFNDITYGGERILKGTVFTRYRQFVENCFEILGRQALHAQSLGFIHPMSGKPMFFDTPLPDDMTQVIERWRKYHTENITQT
ncbi:MAG TPA: RluA family pseudouridine synthase [Bacteroidales bacterium]|nr:RluA family pseudouridine synthase [Bacteroidales bacterium]HSA44578.1 RluA family pseudouridine synthase [Bacteroidales bacterium]